MPKMGRVPRILLLVSETQSRKTQDSKSDPRLLRVPLVFPSVSELKTHACADTAFFQMIKFFWDRVFLDIGLGVERFPMR